MPSSPAASPSSAKSPALPLSAALEPNPCKLFSITQYECTATTRVTCWPLERIFRQCAAGPALEVTNHLVPNSVSEPGVPLVDPKFIAHPPRGKHWVDIEN